MDELETGVLVAVGPSGLHDGAVHVAVTEALRLGTGVELLHVVHSPVVAVPARTEQVRSVDQALSGVGHRVLTDAAERLRCRLGDQVPVSVRMVSGPVARTLVARSAEARLVVLERRDESALSRLLTMSVSSGVAAHAHAPVIVVPATWEPGSGDVAPVTVGVDRPLRAACAVATALDNAWETGSPLVALHATWVAEAYQDILFAGYSRKHWVDDAARELGLSLKRMVAAGDVTCDVHWAPPVDALVEASRHSSLLVLHRRTASHPMAAHLGPVTRAVLQHAVCPVLVVDLIATDEDGLLTPS